MTFTGTNAIPPSVPRIMNSLPMSFVIQLIRKRRNSGSASARCAKLNGKTASSNTPPIIQNPDAASSGMREMFLLPEMSLLIGPAVPVRIEPYRKNASSEPNEGEGSNGAADPVAPAAGQ